MERNTIKNSDQDKNDTNDIAISTNSAAAATTTGTTTTTTTTTTTRKSIILPTHHTSSYYYCASAPGKVILFGEHSVVYGQPAIAAALSDLRIYCHVQLTTTTTIAATTIMSYHDDDDDDATTSSHNGINRRNIYIHMPDLPQSVNVMFPMREFVSSIQGQLLSPPTPLCIQRLELYIQSTATVILMENNTTVTAATTTKPPRNGGLDQCTTHAILPILYLLAQLAPTRLLQIHQQYPLCNNDIRTTTATTKFQNCIITIRSKDLPVGAGLGSSAAFGVACAAALIQWKYCCWKNEVVDMMTEEEEISPLMKGTKTKTITCTLPLTEILIQEINQYAFYSEMLLHGRPSGIDNTVSTHGGILSFTRSHHEVSFDPIFKQSSSSSSLQQNDDSKNSLLLLKEYHLILVDTHIPRQTKQLVASVRKLYDSFPTIINPILDAMGQIAVAFCSTMNATAVNETENGIENNTTHSSIDPILTLVRTNQSLLCALGVSHPTLDHICSTINSHVHISQYAAAKLTGAGGGGCAMILVKRPPPTTSSNNNNHPNIQEIQQDIKRILQQRRRQVPVSHHSNNDDDDEVRIADQPPMEYTFLSSTVGGDGVLFVSHRIWLQL